jgi:CheY-like chemotaxis protein
MGGEVGVESAPGVGATFFVRLPAPLVAAAQAAATPSAPKVGGMKVLVVDDNAANRMVAERLLAAVGVEASSVDSGREALKVLAVEVYDAVLMDLRMPEMDGVGALARLRRRAGPNQHTPVLAFTADAAAEAETVALFDGWVGKPIQPLALLDALAQSQAERAPRADVA